MENSTATPEDSLAVSFKIKIQILHEPAMAFLGICPREMKIYVQNKTCTGIFIEALFVIASNWQHPDVLHGVNSETNSGLSTPGVSLSNKKE